jgi:hypothetical protein
MKRRLDARDRVVIGSSVSPAINPCNTHTPLPLLVLCRDLDWQSIDNARWFLSIKMNRFLHISIFKNARALNVYK